MGRKIELEIKWAIIFLLVGLLWMVLEKGSGWSEEYVDYPLNLKKPFAIPAFFVIILGSIRKKVEFYLGSITYDRRSEVKFLL